MGATVVRYQTKPESADQNQTLIERVFAQLAAERPAGLRYTAYRLADGVTFVHVATVEHDDGENPLTQTSAFSDFVRDIGVRCEVAPVASEAEIVGSYSSFADD